MCRRADEEETDQRGAHRRHRRKYTNVLSGACIQEEAGYTICDLSCALATPLHCANVWRSIIFKLIYSTGQIMVDGDR